MQELIVRWYQFGCFSPVFRTHGCRSRIGNPEENTTAPCGHPKGIQGSCGPNEVWSYGDTTQALLSKYIMLRATMKPYIAKLAAAVSKTGAPTMRPLWYEFPADPKCVGINDQYTLGADILVAPISKQGAKSRTVYFPAGASWVSMWDKTKVKNTHTRTYLDIDIDI